MHNLALSHRKTRSRMETIKSNMTTSIHEVGNSITAIGLATFTWVIDGIFLSVGNFGATIEPYLDIALKCLQGGATVGAILVAALTYKKLRRDLKKKQ